MTTKQSATTGHESSIYQAGGDLIVAQLGITRSELVAEVRKQFLENTYPIVKIAQDAARDAIDGATDRIIDRMIERNPTGFDAFKSPAFIKSFKAAQYAALSLDKSDLAVLADLVVALSKEPLKSLRRVVVEQAIDALPGLTTDQLASLSLVLATQFIDERIVTFEDLVAFLEKFFSPFVDTAASNSSISYKHMVSVGCATSFVSAPLEQYLANNYFPIFADDFGLDIWRAKVFRNSGPESDFIRATADGKYTFTARNEDDLRRQLRRAHAGPNETENVIQFARDQINYGIVRQRLIAVSPNLELAIFLWDETGISSLALNPSGIAIAHANTLAVTGGEIFPLEAILS